MKRNGNQESVMSYCIFDSPVGRILIAGDNTGLKLINFQDGRIPLSPDPHWIEDEESLQEPTQQLKAYFEGRLMRFKLKLAPEGTSFQQRVWNALKRVPFGSTVSYGDIARRIGYPQASRAVGAANGKNPLSIVVPCHRVIGQSGGLVGYGGGLKIKEWLLAHECGRVVTREKSTNLNIEQGITNVECRRTGRQIQLSIMKK